MNLERLGKRPWLACSCNAMRSGQMLVYTYIARQSGRRTDTDHRRLHMKMTAPLRIPMQAVDQDGQSP